MIDHNSSEDKSDIKLDKVTFNQANNWAHKLTTDNKISFNGGEIICWKGIAYYNYEKDDSLTYNIENSKRDDYEKNPTELNNAPDPMDFLNNHLKDENSDKKAADYIVLLTGKAYFYNEQNVTLKKGDIIIPAAYGDGVPVITKNEEGKKVAFDLYSMKQAIEEGFILDVLQNYMTYSTCFKIAKDTPENPELPESRATKIIKKYEKLHPYNISQKSQIIVETFRELRNKKSVEKEK